MDYLEFLKYLEENGVLGTVDIGTIDNKKIAKKYAIVWDSDGWNRLIIYFDKDGNIINND